MAWRTGLALALIVLAVSGCRTGRPAELFVWAAGIDDEVLPGTPANFDSDVFSAERREIRVPAVLNDVAAAQLVLRGVQSGPQALSVTVSDLRGPNGARLSSESIHLYRGAATLVRSFPAWYPQHTGRQTTATPFFDALVPWEAPQGSAAAALSDTQNTLVWIEVHTPLTMEPGEYRGAVSIRAGDRDATTLNLVVDVAPIALPTAHQLPLVMRVDPGELLQTHFGGAVQPAEDIRLTPSDPGSGASLSLVNAAVRELAAHRGDPFVWAGLPALRMLSPREVTVEWPPYDELVDQWLRRGSPGEFGARYWPLPISIDYPDADEFGGVDALVYTAAASSYLAVARAHFDEQQWATQPFIRWQPPGNIDASVEARLVSLSQRAAPTIPLVSHLPAASLRGFGWVTAPSVELTGVGIWAPPAMHYEPAVMAQQRRRGAQTWLAPHHPPYSGSLDVVAGATDVVALGWIAFAYGCQAIWIEDAAAQAGGRGVLRAGRTFGLYDQPVPTLRLKRLRRAASDYELLRLLARNGRPALANRIARETAPYAFTDACRGNLLSTLPASWPRSGAALRLARRLVVQELVNSFAPTATGVATQDDMQRAWRLLVSERRGASVEVVGVRLVDEGGELHARIIVAVDNATPREIRGRWRVAGASAEWSLAASNVTAPPGARREFELAATRTALAYNPDGVLPVAIELVTDDGAVISAAPARLAVAAAPFVAVPPRIDGDISDWPIDVSNAAGDFRLVRRSVGEFGRRPVLNTRVYFCLDDEHLYVAVRCALAPGEMPLAQTNNSIAVEGAWPWGEDLVELVLSPSRATRGDMSTPYLVRIKPTGLVRASHGCPTDPPMARVEPWPAAIRTSVDVRDGVWMTEVALPLEALDLDARGLNLWGVNVTRLDARRGEYSSWSGATGHCYTPQTLGNVLLLRP